MTAFCSINGRRATSANVRVPFAGLWVADVDLDDEAELSMSAIVRVGELELRGVVAATYSGSFGLSSRYRVVAGTGGWFKRLTPRHYHNDAGVKRSTVLLDAAREVGEELVLLEGVEARIGPDFVRQAAPASRILEQVLPQIPWWVDYGGVTRVGARKASEVTAAYDLLAFDPRSKVATLALEDPSAVGVGSILRGRLHRPLLVRSVELQLTKGALRMVVSGKELSS